MNGIDYLIDSNILIGLLNGDAAFARLARRAKPKATAFPRSNGAYNNFRLLLDRFIFCHDAEAIWAALNRTDRLMSRQDVDYSCTEHWLYGPAHRYLGRR